MNFRTRLDELNKALLIFGGACYLISFIIGRGSGWSTLFRLLFAGAMVFLGIRLFAGNENARYRENQKFLTAATAVKEFFTKGYHAAGNRPVRAAGDGLLSKWKKAWHDYRTYRFLICPQCTQRLRVPRGKGQIRVKCTKCGHQFLAKS